MKVKYQVELTPAAQRQVKKLPCHAQRLVLKTFEALGINPKPEGVKKLVGLGNLYRVKSRDYRIIYTIEEHKLLVLIVKVGDRKEVYRNL